MMKYRRTAFIVQPHCFLLRASSGFTILLMSLVPYFFETMTSKAKMTALTAVSVENAKNQESLAYTQIVDSQHHEVKVAAVAINSMEMKTLSK